MGSKIKNIILSPITRKWLFWLSVIAVLGAVFLVLYWQVLPQPAVYLLNNIVVPDKGESMLVFSPHCDDESIAAAGLVQQALHNGATVNVAMVTDCNKHHNENKRYDELRLALGVLGLTDKNITYLKYPDGEMGKQDPVAVKQKFAALIAQLKPKLLVAPTDRDTHIDHRVTGKLIQQIAKEQNKPLYQYLVHYPYFPSPKKFVPGDYLLPPLKLITTDKRWLKLDLSETEEDLKNEAILQYKTQLKNRMVRGILLGSIRKNELFAQPL